MGCRPPRDHTRCSSRVVLSTIGILLGWPATHVVITIFFKFWV